MLTAWLKKMHQNEQVFGKQILSGQDVVRHMTVSVLCFFFTRITLLGFMNGFGMAAAAAVPLPFSAAGFIGCLTGEFFNGLDGKSLFHLLLLTGWIAGRQILQIKAFPRHYLGLFWRTSLFGSILTVREVIFYFITEPPLMDFFKGMLGVLLQLLVFMVFGIAASAFCIGKPFAEYSRLQAESLVTIMVLLTTALGRYHFSGISAAGIAAVLMISVSAFRFGVIGGTLAGILSGFGIWLYDTALLETAGIMMLTGCFAGLTAQRGKLYTAAGMVLFHGILVLIHGKPLFMLPVTLCTLLGETIFLCIPENLLRRIVLPQALCPAGPPEQQDLLCRRLSSRLQIRMLFASDTVQMLLLSVSELADALKQNVRPDMEQVCETVRKKLCRRCRRRHICYGSEYDRLRESCDSLGSMMRCRGEIHQEELPDFLNRSCLHQSELIRVYADTYQFFSNLSAQQRQMSRTRKLILEQYDATAELLRNFSRDILLHPDIASEDVLSEMLAREGYAPKQLCCQKDDSGHLFIDLYYPGNIPPAEELSELLERQLGTALDHPVISDGSTLTRISFFEPPLFGIQIGVSQKASGNSSFNGDTVTSFYDGSGSFYLLLSDGMGRGKQAALDSMTVCTILQKLIQAGFGWRASLKLLNTSLMIKSAEETLATVDIIRVDLYDGDAEFIKAGAAASFFVGDRSISRVRSFTLPVGIVSDVDFDSKIIRAEPGNIMLLVSDGVGEEDEWIARELAAGKDLKISELTDRICTLAQKQAGKEPDDITAAGIRLIRYEISE